MDETAWRTVDFTVAPAGWRMIGKPYIKGDIDIRAFWGGQMWSVPIVGWLRQEATQSNGTQQRLVAAVNVGQGRIQSVDSEPFGHCQWWIRGPGQDDRYGVLSERDPLEKPTRTTAEASVNRGALVTTLLFVISIVALAVEHRLGIQSFWVFVWTIMAAVLAARMIVQRINKRNANG